MKKVSTLSAYTLLGMFLCFCTLVEAQDFKIQEVQDDVDNSGIPGASGYAQVTNTTTGFTAVSSTNSAFALPSNNRKTHGGPSGSSNVRQGRDMAGARVLTAANTITYYRETSSELEETRFNTSIWEYTGVPAGPNEFIVRGRYAVDLNGGTYSTNQTISGISNKDKCIPFITGIMNDSGTGDADSGTAIAYLDSSTNIKIRRGGSNIPNVRVYVTLVEFTGSNWAVLHGDSGADGADIGTITLKSNSNGSSGTDATVSNWDNAIIFSQHRGDTATNGTNDAHGDNWPMTKIGSDDKSVDWKFHGSHDSDGSNRHFVHVLNNDQVSVTRFSDGTTDNTTVDISSAGLVFQDQAMIIGSTYHSGGGLGYGRGWRNYKLNSTTQAEFWSARVGGGQATVENELQIINFATEGPGGINTNLQLWLKADTGAEKAGGIPAVDSDPIVNWIDNTINTNDATASVSNEPTFIENGFNFNPILDFDGANSEMTTSTNANDEITIFAVAEGTYASTKSLINLSDGNNNSSVDIEQTAATTFSGRYNDGTVNSGVVTNVITPVTTGTPYLLNYRHLAGSTNRLFVNGIQQAVVSANADNLNGTLTAGIGADPSSTSTRWDGGIAEMIVYNYKVPLAERWQIESYLAIKYGLTLGVNGTSQDYVDSDGRVIWDIDTGVPADDAFNYNVAGVGQDNSSALNQKQSKTINSTDDITVGIKQISTTNQGNTSDFFTDKTFLMWGHNDATGKGPDITKDFGAGTGVSGATLTASRLNRVWKIVVTDTVPTVKLSIPESMVLPARNGTEDYIMIVSDSADFTLNVTSATMKVAGTDLEVDWYFEGTKYITFGSAPEVDLGSRSVTFDRTDSYISAGDVNDLDDTSYTVSAWIKREPGVGKFDVISKRNYSGEDISDLNGIVSGTYDLGYAFRISEEGNLRMVWRDPDDILNNKMETSANIPEDEWHHVCATYDINEGPLGTTRLYVDGIETDVNNTYNPINSDTDEHFMIGAANYKNRQQKLNGSVDEVRVWNVALSSNQLRYIMNQEIEENGDLNVNGKILPATTTKNEVDDIPWNNLIAYYPMSTAVFGSIKDESNSGNDASMINYDNIDYQTAPLPYKTVQPGAWDDETTWENGNVQYLPGVVSYLYENEAVDTDKQTMDYNIVQINHIVTMNNALDPNLIPDYKANNRTVLGLIINSGELKLDGDTPPIFIGTPPPGWIPPSGNAITVSHYLKLDGTLDLEGESQLIQMEGSDIDPLSSGNLERDQQGTGNTYLYNYWSSPVAPSSNLDYTTSNIISNVGFLTSGYDGNANSSSPANADYWIWKYANNATNDYSQWQHVRSSGPISAGEGFTMKGPGAGSLEQNYVLSGLPNNGDISLAIAAGNDYLVGNPYPSAIDADEFIKDNLSNLEIIGYEIDGTTPIYARNPNGNIINGTLYFWEHFAVNSHQLAEYQGGYATYTLMGGALAVNNDTRIDADGSLGTKLPGRYIPVSQGFFVSAFADPTVVYSEPIVGGNILFKNSQRIFEIEGENSLFLKSSNTKIKTATSNQKKDTRQKIRLMFDSPKGYHRQLLAGVDASSSSGFDIGYDAPLIEDNKEDMFWLFENAEFIIQAVDHFNVEQILPLGVKINQEGLATIRIDNLENISNDLNIFLHDKELNIYHDLKDGYYEVFLTAGKHLERFEITFANNIALSTDTIENDNLQVYFSNEKESIIIHNPTSKLVNSVELYNILGQSIYSLNKKTSENYIEHKTKQIRTGTYIIKIKTDEGTSSKKVLVN